MKRWVRFLASIFASVLIVLSPSMAYAGTKDDECDAGGVRYFECIKKQNEEDCAPNLSCDSTRTDSIALIGDSIATNASIKAQLQQAFPGLKDEYYDAKKNRPWNDGLQILKDKMLSRDIIIYELGTNNDANFHEQDIQNVMDIVGNSKTVVFVTNYTSGAGYVWFKDHNQLFKDAVNKYNNVAVADWASVAAQNSFKLDGMAIHPSTSEEEDAFANVIIDTVKKDNCRVGPVELLGTTAEEKIWSGLLSAGFTKEQAAGIMGNMEGESGYNPARHENSEYENYWNNGAFDLSQDISRPYGLGLIQWSYDRRVSLYAYIKQKAPDLLQYFEDPDTYGYYVFGDEFLSKAGTDGEELMSFELAYLYQEVSTTSSYKGILSKTTVEGASEFFTRYIEIPAYVDQAVPDRITWSLDKYNKYKDRQDLIPSTGVKTISSASNFKLADYTFDGTNKDYNGDDVFSDAQLAKIEEFRPFYEEAVEGTNIPWEILAAIHARESSLSRINPNSDGLFQMLGGSYTPGEYVTDDDFREQLKGAVEQHLIPAQNYMPELSGDDMYKRIIYAYNSGTKVGLGNVYAIQARDLGFTEEQALIGEGSPYVVNKIDARRDPNKATGNTWGQIKKDYGPIEYPANQDHGAYVMYVALHGGDAGANGCGGSSANLKGAKAINAKAVEFAWPLGNEHNSRTPNHGDLLVATTAYETAAKDMNNWYSNGGADCSFFVGTVVAASGVDPDFPKAGSALQTDYLQNSDKWINLSAQNDGKDESFLQAGDILIVPHVGKKCGHVRVIVDLGNGTLGTAEASLDSHSGEIHDYIGLDAGGGRGLYQVYRLKN